MTSVTAAVPRARTATPRLGPALLAGLAVVCLAGALTLDLVTPATARAAAGGELATVTGAGGVLLLLAAAHVLHHRPRHRVGLALAAVGAAGALDGVLAGWASYGHAGGLPGTDLAFWYVWRVGPVLLSGLVTLLLLYPTGSLVRGRARPVAVVVLVAAYLLPVVALVVPDAVVLDGAPGSVRTDLLTLPLPAAVAERLLDAAVVAVFAALAAAIVLVWVRHRGADAHERTQLRWLLWAGLVTALVVAAAATLSISGPVTASALHLAVALVAASMSIGLVRPGLGDVDALVAGTLTWGAVAAVVLAVDLAVLAAADAVLGDRLGQREVAVLALALAVAVYGPLRGLLGGAVRRLLLGPRHDRYAAVSSLAARLERSGTVAEQLPALATAVASTFTVPFVRVEVVRPDGGLLAASHGAATAHVREIDIAYQGRTVGRLVLPARGLRAMLSPTDQGLLVDLVRQAAIAMRAGLLAEELQGSRERLVRGREDDRRRIRRDLHDGLGPALGGVALQLAAADNAVDRDPGRARALVRTARAEVQEALEDVRRLVHDLRPPALDDLGLEEAIRSQAARHATSLDVDVRARGLAGLPAGVEVAAYRIVGEALTNVTRHAEAGRCTVRLEGDGTDLAIEVTDDGSGIGPDVAAGVGLLSMRERAEELGGTCEVTCPPGGGTVVRALLPLAVPEPP